MLLQFTSWLASRFPVSAHRHDNGFSEIKLRYFDGALGLEGIAIQHRERDGETLAPFPDEWKDWALFPIQSLTAPRDIGSEIPAVPNFKEFADNIPELEARGVEMKKRRKKALKS